MIYLPFGVADKYRFATAETGIATNISDRTSKICNSWQRSRRTWTTYILWFLHKDGALRFGELRRKIGSISTKVLTERLRMMESMGIVDRHYEPTIPPQVTYSLTDRGKELTKALTPLYKLALRWNAE